MIPSKTTKKASKKTIFLFLEGTPHADIIATAVRLTAQKQDTNIFVVTTNRSLEPFFKDCPEQLLLKQEFAIRNRSLTKKTDLLRFSTLAQELEGILQTPEFEKGFEKAEIELFQTGVTTMALQTFFAEKQASVIKEFLKEQGVIDRIIVGLSPEESPTGLSASAVLRAARDLKLKIYLMLPHEDTRGFKSLQFLNLFERVFAIEAVLGQASTRTRTINNRFINKIMHVLKRRLGSRKMSRVVNDYLGSKLSQQFF